MTCEHAACTATATVKTRFGDGSYGSIINHDAASKRGHPGSSTLRHRQTFVHYCPAHFEQVDRLFFLSDVRLIAQAA